MDARVEGHHHQRRRHALARYIAQCQAHAGAGVGEEIVVVASHGAAGNVEAGRSTPAISGAREGSMPVWIRRLRQIALA